MVEYGKNDNSSRHVLFVDAPGLSTAFQGQATGSFGSHFVHILQFLLFEMGLCRRKRALPFAVTLDVAPVGPVDGFFVASDKSHYFGLMQSYAKAYAFFRRVTVISLTDLTDVG